MMDKDYLYQIDIREWIERGLDADIMVPVSGNKIDKKYDIYLQSFLLPLNEVENDMENDTYNAHTLMPGITVYGSWEDDEKVYHRWGNDNGYEPLVIKREYNGVASNHFCVSAASVVKSLFHDVHLAFCRSLCFALHYSMEVRLPFGRKNIKKFLKRKIVP